MKKTKQFIKEADYGYYYKDLVDGATYRVSNWGIDPITNSMYRLSFENCDFNKRVEVDWETLN